LKDAEIKERLEHALHMIETLAKVHDEDNRTKDQVQPEIKWPESEKDHM